MDPGDSDDRRLEPGTEAWEEERRHRHGHPRGAHIRAEDAEMPPRPVSDYVSRGDRSELAAMLRQMDVQASPPPAKSKLDLTLNIPTMVLLGGMLVGGAQGWINLTERIAANERGVQESRDRATKYVPVIEALQEAVRGQIGENKAQSDTINAIRESINEERRQRSNDGTETRRALSDIAKTLNELVTEQAVQKDRQGRRGDHSEIPGASERDAQLRPR